MAGARIAGLGFEDNRAVQAVFLKRGTDIEAVIFVADDHGLSCVGCRHGPAQSVFEQRMTAFQRHELFRVCSSRERPQPGPAAAAQNDRMNAHTLLPLLRNVLNMEHHLG